MRLFPCIKKWVEIAFDRNIFHKWFCVTINNIQLLPLDTEMQCSSVQSVHSLSHVQLFVTPWTTAHQACLSIINSWNLLKLMSIESMMPSSHLILYRPLLLLPPIPPSIKVFSNESTLPMRWPKYWSFSFSISPSNEHPGLISFRMDWLDLFAVMDSQESSPTPKSWKQNGVTNK